MAEKKVEVAEKKVEAAEKKVEVAEKSNASLIADAVSKALKAQQLSAKKDAKEHAKEIKVCDSSEIEKDVRQN